MSAALTALDNVATQVRWLRLDDHPRMNAIADMLEFFNKRCEKYDELLYAVARKYPGETRHQTALRYIMEREQEPHGDTGAKAAEIGPRPQGR
jgi:hypothetical protein